MTEFGRKEDPKLGLKWCLILVLGIAGMMAGLLSAFCPMIVLGSIPIFTVCIEVGLTLRASRGRLMPTPSLLFVSQYVVFISLGTLRQATIGKTSMEVLAVLSLPIGFLLMGQMFCRSCHVIPFRGPMRSVDDLRGPRNGFFVIVLGLSLLVFAVGIHRLGLPILTALETSVGTSDLPALLKSARISATYQTSGYKGVGYIHQFRVVVLPLLSLISLASAMISRRLSRWFQAGILLIIAMGWSASTGQRWPIMSLFMALAIMIVFLRPKGWKRLMSLVAVSGVVVFLVLTFLNGRFEYGSTVGATIRGTVANALERVFFDQSSAAAFGADYVLRHPRTWGAELANSLGQILPGPQKPTLAGVLFTEIYGASGYGTTPVPIFVQFMADFGWLGLAVGSVLLGYALAALDSIVLWRSNRTAVNCALWSISIASIAAMSIGGIETLVTQGFLGASVFRLGLHLYERLFATKSRVSTSFARCAND